MGPEASEMKKICFLWPLGSEGALLKVCWAKRDPKGLQMGAKGVPKGSQGFPRIAKKNREICCGIDMFLT